MVTLKQYLMVTILPQNGIVGKPLFISGRWNYTSDELQGVNPNPIRSDANLCFFFANTFL